MNSFHVPFLKGNNGYDDVERESLKDHDELSERLRKTLYYGKHPTTDRPSLPLTNLTVDFLNDAVPRQLGRIDHYFASSSARHSCMSPCSMMMGMIYVKRLKKRNPEYLQQVSSSDLFLISMMMASKFLYDEGVDDEVFNDEWAASADMETEDINELERQFLSAIDWQLYVNDKEFNQVLQDIEKRIAITQGLDRGWFSYTDFFVLSQDAEFQKMLEQISTLIPKYMLVFAFEYIFNKLHMLAVTTIAYIAGILTMIGSTLVVTSMMTTLSALAPVTSVGKEPTIMPIAETPEVENESKQEFPNSKQEVVEDVKPKTAEGTLSSLWTLITLPSILSLPELGHSDEDLPSSKDESLDARSPTKVLHDNSLKFFYILRDIFSFSFPGRRTENHLPNNVVCANGPCLFSGRNDNCKNVTKGNHNNSPFSKYSNSHEQRNQQVLRNFDCPTCRAHQNIDNLGKWDRFCRIRDRFVDYSSMDDGHISCCCNYVTAEMDRSIMNDRFADISLGFHTEFSGNSISVT